MSELTDRLALKWANGATFKEILEQYTATIVAELLDAETDANTGDRPFEENAGLNAAVIIVESYLNPESV